MSDNRDDENAQRVPTAEPSPPAEAAQVVQPASAEAAHDVGAVTAAMPQVAPVAPPTASAPALHLQVQAQNVRPAIIIPQIPDYLQRKPQPLIGPLVSVYGALLWSFVIAGQLTTSWMSSGPLDERWAVLIVFVATVTTGIIVLRRAQAAAPVTAVGIVGRAAFAFGGGLVAWVATVFVAALAGNTASRNHDVLIAMALVVLAVTASVLGPRLTTPGPQVAPSHGRKVMQVMFWFGLAVVTLIAGAELVANG